MSTADQLRRITFNTPPELARSLMKTVIDTTMEDTVRAIIADRATPYKEAEKLKRLLETGAFRREDTVVDEKVAKKIERYNEVMIESYKKKGLLDDPMRDEYFKRRMYKRMEAMKKR